MSNNNYKNAVLLLLPAITFAKINIDIKTGSKTCPVGWNGSNVKIISDKEIKLFNYTEENLKKGARVYLKRVPDDVFLKSPTPWGDLYKKFRWKQVSRTITVETVELLDVVTIKPVTLLTHSFVNNSSKITVVNTGVKQIIKNTAKQMWTEGDFSQFHNVYFNFTISAGNSSINYKSRWGENINVEDIVSLGTENGLEVKLKPKEGVTARLEAKRGVMRLKFVFLVKVDGEVAVNYRRRHNGHHFWSLFLDDVVEGAGLRRALWGSMVLDIVFYSEPTVVLLKPP